METKKLTVLCPGCGALCEEKAAWCSACGSEIGKDAIRILPAGTLLDQERYTLTGYVGRGGSAITYRARQRNFTSEIVLREYFPSLIARRAEDGQKVIPAELSEEMAFERGKFQFRREGDSLRSLRDISNIVTVYDVFEDNNTVYMVEDYIKGESLQTFLAREGKMSFRQAMQIMAPVMKALSAVHGHEIIHRDVKPSNIMLEKGVPCLIDFGISRKILEATTLSGDPAQRTRTIASSYTKGYAALEQITGEERETAAVDVYGAAATLYRMVTGASPDDALARQKQDYLLSPIDAGALVTKRQSDLIMKGLALHAGDRFQNMQVFLNLLEESLQDVEKKEPDRPRGLIFVFLGILAALCLLLLVFKLGTGPSGSFGKPETAEGSAAEGRSEEKQESPEEQESLEVQDSQEESEPAAEKAVPQEGLLRLTAFRGSTYAFYDMEKAGIGSYDDMTSFAAGLGACPAVIDSYEENTFLYNQTLAAGALSAYFGFHIGAGDDRWTWPEGKGSGYTHWDQEDPRPDKGPEGESYARFSDYYRNGRWEYSSLDTRYPLILEWDHVLEGAEVLEGPEKIFDIPTFVYRDSVYGIYDMSSYGLDTIKTLGFDNEDEEFDYLVDFCRVRGGYLAVIGDENENAFLFDKVKESGEESAFFGYTDNEEEGSWVWIDRDSSYENWASGQPNNGVGTPAGDVRFGEDYAQFFLTTGDGTWNDSMIHVNTQAFIMEWDK